MVSRFTKSARAGLVSPTRLALVSLIGKGSKSLHDWSTLRRMQWAKEAYWFGMLDYALEILMEIAEEEINVHVQETFDPYCQPIPKRKEAKRGEVSCTEISTAKEGEGVDG